MSSLALMDFDGTITEKDSLAGFIQFAVGSASYYLGLLKLSPMLAAYVLKIIPNDIAKEKMLGYYFKGWDFERYEAAASQYSLEEIDKIVRPKAMEKIRWHQEQGHRVVIVSASMECWLKPWCERNGIELVSTKLEVCDGMLSGKLATKNCYGIEKANRVKELYDLQRYDKIFAYGDSSGDRELLALATEAFFKPFR